MVLGSTGECVSLSDAESEALVRAARKTAAPGKTVIAGTARESTRLTIDFTNRMADAGVDAALVRSPAYYKSRMTQDALKAHFLAVADKARVPVIVYNIPANTGISLEASLVIELSGPPQRHRAQGKLGEHRLSRGGHPPGPAGVPVFPRLRKRVPAGPRARRLRGHPGRGQRRPGALLEDLSLVPRGEARRSAEAPARPHPLNKALMEGTGIAGLKHALDLRGYYGGPVRLPLLPPGDAAKAEIAALMTGLGLV